MRIAISSDNHLDVNQIDPHWAVNQQADWLVSHRIDQYYHLGDLFNNFQRTQAYVHELQQRVGGLIKIRYLAGNHDLISGIREESLEKLADPLYFHNSYFDVPQTDWRLIGINGWYDYTFSPYQVDRVKVAHWKRVYWIDGGIPQRETDQARLARQINDLDEQLQAASQDKKKVILLTHFVPTVELVPPMPSQFNRARQIEFWNMLWAMLGSQRFGEKLATSAIVKRVVFGHLHGQPPVLKVGGVNYYNAAVGVKRRYREWQMPTFMAQWEKRLIVWEL
ncbi:phosphoesterase [Lactobacillus sp. 3B(2020)]|nr:phosphoesterase [Lactobacillus sp. 3B(2020)]